MDKEVPENANEHCPGANSSAAGKESACKGCPNQSVCASGTLEVNPAIAVIADKLKSIKHKILVLSGKGGVGKSTVATQLALLLSQKHEVGLLDVDICGPSVPTMLGLVGQEVHQSNAGWSPVFAGDLAVMSIGFLLGNQNDAVIWRGPRKNGLIQQFLQEVNWGDLDYLIIDSTLANNAAPPGTSDEHLSLCNF
uniref:Uncharacterized protein n=1 Tax=Nymphaea colorata TaxID=210225 RepID=A0A5K1HFK4_9MAGN|nr:unnamed protein product [Nymphaea colorata]